jgi:hypothetical protein
LANISAAALIFALLNCSPVGLPTPSYTVWYPVAGKAASKCKRPGYVVLILLLVKLAGILIIYEV